MSEQKTGFIAIVGRPNVGKSTLLNHLLGTKLSITSRKPQTTQHQILGVLSHEETQLVFIDTPGLKKDFRDSTNALGSYIRKQALGVLPDVDASIFVCDARTWTSEDDYVLSRLKAVETRAVCALNKIDRMADKRQLLSRIEHISKLHDFEAFVPVSALRKDGLDTLLGELKKLIPQRDWIYEANEFTDHSSRFLVCEIVREQLFRQLGEELPYQTAVLIEKYREEKTKTTIHALVIVEKESQKGIVVGKNGKRLKAIGSAARAGVTELLGTPVDLFLKVRTQQNWTSDRSSVLALSNQ